MRGNNSMRDRVAKESKFLAWGLAIFVLLVVLT